jgi:hypothetical protein
MLATIGATAAEDAVLDHRQQQQQQLRLYRCQMGRESGASRARQCPLGCRELVRK